MLAGQRTTKGKLVMGKRVGVGIAALGVTVLGVYVRFL